MTRRYPLSVGGHEINTKAIDAPALMCVCRQIYREASPYFYTVNHIEYSGIMPDEVIDRVKRLAPHHLSLIKRIDLLCHIEDMKESKSDLSSDIRYLSRFEQKLKQAGIHLKPDGLRLTDFGRCKSRTIPESK